MDAERSQFYEAARAWYTAQDNAQAQRRLCDAACAYTDARRALASGQTTAKRQADAKEEVTLPFGRSKGKPLHAASKGDLEWMLGVLEESIANPEKERWREKNAELLEAVRAELARR